MAQKSKLSANFKIKNDDSFQFRIENSDCFKKGYFEKFIKLISDLYQKLLNFA